MREEAETFPEKKDQLKEAKEREARETAEVLMKTVTQSQYLQLVGLLTLSKIHSTKVNDSRDAIRELLECNPNSNEGDHVDDGVWGTDNPNADDLLKRMGIVVKKQK